MNAMTRGRALNPPILIGIILIAVVLLALCVAAAMFVFDLVAQMGRPTGPIAGEPVSDLTTPTAREAYPTAVELIREEDAGAQLASAAGAWTPVIDRTNLQDGRTGWTFHFYLPATHRMAWVTVSRDLRARISHVEAWETPPGLLDDQGWQIDSPQALQMALGTCSPVLDAYENASVEARLTLAAASRALIWEIRVVIPDNPAGGCSAYIDATTGQPR